MNLKSTFFYIVCLFVLSYQVLPSVAVSMPLYTVIEH